MRPVAAEPDLWELVYLKPWIDPNALLAAVSRECANPAPDFRTRLLLRDSFDALKHHFGPAVIENRLDKNVRQFLDRLGAEDLGEPKFLNLERRMANSLDPQTILQFLRDLGSKVPTS